MIALAMGLVVETGENGWMLGMWGEAVKPEMLANLMGFFLKYAQNDAS